MNRPLVRAIVTCDHSGCSVQVDIRAGPTDGREEHVETVFAFGRKVAEALGWQCGLAGEPNGAEEHFAIPGHTLSRHRVADGRDLCPAHRK